MVTRGNRLLLFAIIVTAGSGCGTIEKRSIITAASRGSGPITHVAVLWSEAVLRQDNVPVVQGFAGKLYLFSESSSAVAAPGKFTIYAYDDTDAANDPEKAGHVKPDFTWELMESDLKELMKKDAIGWSYSIWLPCGPPSSVERRYSIMVHFTPDNAPRVISESTLVTLPPVSDSRGTALCTPNHHSRSQRG